jgi:hypothetical protein
VRARVELEWPELIDAGRRSHSNRSLIEP